MSLGRPLNEYRNNHSSHQYDYQTYKVGHDWLPIAGGTQWLAEKLVAWCVLFTHIVPTPKFKRAECQYSARHYILGNIPTNLIDGYEFAI